MNKLLMEENDRLQKQVSQLVYENGYYRQQTQSVRVLPLIAQLLLPLPHLPFQAAAPLCLCSPLRRCFAAGGAGDHGHELRVGRHQRPPERGRGAATSPAARRGPCRVRTT
jgi:hypothetical protein